MFRNDDKRRLAGTGRVRGSGEHFKNIDKKHYPGTRKEPWFGNGWFHEDRRYQGTRKRRGSVTGREKIDKNQYYSNTMNSDYAGAYTPDRFYEHNRHADYPQYNDPTNADSTGADIVTLKNRARLLEEQLKDVVKRIQALQSKPAFYSRKTEEALLAIVDERLCVGCGICEKTCPVQAIHMNEIAHVDSTLCTGCGNCVQSCRRRAITLMSLED